MDSGLTLVDLAGFTGKDTPYYTRYVAEALVQAGDLFELATGLTVMPSGGDLSARIAKRGVLAMAEALYEGQPSRDLRFSPFRSETIGSYTYSLAQNSVSEGVPTGIGWFDLAVIRLRTVSAVSNSSISVFDRPGDVLEVAGEDYLVGPADMNNYRGSPVLNHGNLIGTVHPSLVDGVDWPFS